MQRSYIDYAMSVIVGRALPEVRDGLVRLAQPWSMRYPLIDGQGNFGSPGNDPAAAMRYTEARLTPLAMEMLADIDEDTVDFQPNYDGKNSEPLVLPGRIPNLLINGSAGIEDGYRTGRGSVRMRAVVTVEEDTRGRVQLVVTELPYQVNPDNLAESIADAVRDGRLQGISEIADESSDRVGRRLVITLRRDAVAKVVLNNLYKHTQLQTTFGCNMLSIVDGVPRTLRLDELVRHFVEHQIEEEEVVLIITRPVSAKRTKSVLFRSQRDGVTGVRGAALKQYETVDH